jgi:tetratricopeptide (TPR) repeat protein
MSVVATCLLMSLLLLAQEPTADQIADAVRQLGDDNFTVREKATEFLWKVGRQAEKALEAAAQSDDRETAIRAAEVLEKVRLGVFPDTPPELLQLIRTYQRGGLDQKRVVLSQLRQKKQHNTMFSLIRGEPDKLVRKQLAREFVTDGRKVASDLAAAENYSAAEEMLSWSASVDETTRSQRDYAAFLYLRGRLPEKLAELRAKDDEPDDKDAARLSGTMLLVQGEYREALKLANLSSDRALQNDLLFRLEDWKALAKEEQLPDGQPVERLGCKAAYHRLLGDEAGFKQTVDEIMALPMTNEEQGWLAAEVLMVNGRWEDAGAILRKWDRYSAFQLLCAQLKFREALKFAGLEDSTQATTWFAERGKTIAANSQESWQHFNLGLRLSRVLRDLGEIESSAKLLDAVAGFQADPDGLRSQHVFVEQWRQGQREAALPRAVSLLTLPARAPAVAQEMFGGLSSAAVQCWTMLRELDETADGLTMIHQLQQVLDPKQAWPFSTNLAEWSAEAEKRSRGMAPAQQALRLKALAEIASLRGDRVLERQYLERWIALATGADVVLPLLRLADSHGKDDDWSEAAKAYRRAWEPDKSFAPPLYLQGLSLVKAGEKDEGERLVQLAMLLPLADPFRRHQLAASLEERGFAEQAHEQRQLVVRFGAPGTWAGNDDWYFRDAARLAGNHLESTDPLVASRLWERVLFGVLRSNSFFWERSDYAQMFYAVHKVRSRGLLTAGRTEDALHELALAREARPGDIEVVEQVRPLLIKAGLTEAAEKVFSDVFALHEEISKEFPNSARYHNELAWLSARNDLRLDDALAHAEQAVKLQPEAANYIDTLAEVHFRRGNREKALEFAKQALKLEPRNKHFQTQVERFQK